MTKPQTLNTLSGHGDSASTFSRRHSGRPACLTTSTFPRRHSGRPACLTTSTFSRRHSGTPAGLTANIIRLLLVISYCSLVIGPLASRPVAAQDPPPDTRFGAVEAFRDPVAAVEAGVAWERILFYWSELQPNGPDEWNGYHVPDDWLTLAAAGGREVVGLLKHTPAWATDGPPGCGVPRGLELPLDDPGNLWAAFVRRTVGHYAGRINHWIIWNEPDIAPETYGAEWCGSVDDYYQLLKVAYLAAHQTNPDVVIHLAGTTTWHDKTYLRRLLTIATQDPTGAEHGHYFDVVSLHIYFRPETVPQIFSETRATLAAYGLQKAIWLNETNAPPNSDPEWYMPQANYEVSLEEQAGFLLQSFALGLSSGAKRIAVYKWLDNDLPPHFEPFGIIRPDFSHRPAYDAYRAITTHYIGTLSAREDRSPLYTTVTLDRGTHTTRVLWARTESDVTVSVAALAPQARLVDQTGAEQIIEPVNGQYTLTLPRARCADSRGCIIGGPTYLLVEDSGAAPPPVETVTPAAPTPAPPTIEPTPTEAWIEGTAPAPTEVVTPTISADTPTPVPTATSTPTETPTPTPTPVPTETPSPTPVPTATQTATPSPSLTPTPLPAPPTATATPTPTPRPTTPAQSARPAWPLLLGLAAVVLLAAIVGTLFRYRP